MEWSYFMSDFKKDLTVLNPVKTYDPPKLPSLIEVKNDPALLKVLPERWKSKSKVLTCIGLIGAGMLSLSGCAGDGVTSGEPPVIIAPTPDTNMHHGGSGGVPIYVEGSTEQGYESFIPTQIITEDLVLRAHYGGSGAGPFYVVYLTEQEAMSIILSQLEEAGFRFDSEPPENFVKVQDDFSLHIDNYKLDLFDEHKGVAITSVGFGSNNWLANHVANEFRNQDPDFSVGVFFTPGLSPDSVFGYQWDSKRDEDDWNILEPDDDEVAQAKEKARPVLEKQLNSQIQQFLDFLIGEGTIAP